MGRRRRHDGQDEEGMGPVVEEAVLHAGLVVIGAEGRGLYLIDKEIGKLAIK